MAQLRRGGTSGKLLDSKWGAAGGMQRTLPRFNQLQNPGESIYTASLRSRVHTASPHSTLAPLRTKPPVEGIMYSTLNGNALIAIRSANAHHDSDKIVSRDETAQYGVYNPHIF